VIQQHLGKFLKGRQPLPSQFIDPALQVAQHRSFSERYVKRILQGRVWV
jgi:hypothetical protein